MADWFWVQNGQQHGPVDSNTLQHMAQSGELRPETLVWREGLSDWAPARLVEGLFTPPAPPSSPPVPVPQAPPIQYVCAHCGAKLSAPPELAGTEAACDGCGQVVTVPLKSQKTGLAKHPWAVFGVSLTLLIGLIALGGWFLYREVNPPPEPLAFAAVEDAIKATAKLSHGGYVYMDGMGEKKISDTAAPVAYTRDAQIDKSIDTFLKIDNKHFSESQKLKTLAYIVPDHVDLLTVGLRGRGMSYNLSEFVVRFGEPVDIQEDQELYRKKGESFRGDWRHYGPVSLGVQDGRVFSLRVYTDPWRENASGPEQQFAEIITSKDQNFLKRAAMTPRNGILRLVAIEKLKDQKTLADIAISKDYLRDEKIGRAAVERITDPRMFVRILKEGDENAFPYYYAIKHCKDQDALIDTAMKAGDAGKVAASRVTDQKRLAQILLDYKDRIEHDPRRRRWISDELVARITDQAALKKLATQARETQVRNKALRLMTDQAAILEIALADKRGHFTRTATERISDPKLLKQFAIETKSPYAGTFIIPKIKDSGMLEAIALNANLANVRNQAVQKITDPASLLKIHRAEKISFVRRTIARQLKDEAALAELLKSEKDKNTRYDIVRRITAQPALTAIALNDPMTSLRLTAVSKLTDQKTLAKIAMEDKDAGVRKLAKQKITNPDILKWVGAWLDPDLTALLTDQAELLKIAKEAKDPLVRLAATGNLTDQAALTEFAMKDPRATIRETAVRKLTDKETLMKIAETEKLTSIAKAAVEKLTDTADLMRIVQSKARYWVKMAALNRINDRAAIEKIAKEHPSGTVRSSAVNRLVIFKSPEELMEIARNGRVAAQRIIAIGMLSDQTLLKKLANEDKNESVQRAAIGQLTDQDALKALLKKTKNGDVRKAIIERLTDQALLKEIVEHPKAIYDVMAAISVMTDKAALKKLTEGPAGSARQLAKSRLKQLAQQENKNTTSP